MQERFHFLKNTFVVVTLQKSKNQKLLISHVSYINQNLDSTVDEYLKIHHKDQNLYVLQELGGMYFDKSKKIKTIYQLKEIMINNTISE